MFFATAAVWPVGFSRFHLPKRGLFCCFAGCRRHFLDNLCTYEISPVILSRLEALAQLWRFILAKREHKVERVDHGINGGQRLNTDHETKGGC